MKTVVSEVEVNRVPADSVSIALSKMPFNGQDDTDSTMAKHFLYKAIAKIVNSWVDKTEKKLKEEFNYEPERMEKVILSENYRTELTRGTARQQFDGEAFINGVIAAYPNVEKFKLREIMTASTKFATAPVSIEIEYIGDVVRRQN